MDAALCSLSFFMETRLGGRQIIVQHLFWMKSWDDLPPAKAAVVLNVARRLTIF